MKIFVPTPRGKTYWFIQLLIWFNLIFYIAVMLVQIMGYLPREKIWNPIVKGRCINLLAMLIAEAVINIILDFSILVLSIGKIWQLQMSNRSKLGVSAIFTASLL